MPLPNPFAMGNAWLVQDVKMVSTPDDEIAELSKTNLKQFAIVNQEFDSKLTQKQFDGNGSIKLTSYSPNKMVYEANCSGSQLAVFSEIWYGPDLGWQLSIDGKEVDLIRANYVLRACQIPDGKHQIVMEFKPKSFMLGKNLSMICSLLLIGLMGFVAYKEFMKFK